MTWIYALPAWLLTVGAIVIMSAFSVGGLLLTRLRFPRSDQITHNDVAGPVIGTLGTILAVVLSFMVITVWQEFDQAAATVQTEVNAVCDLYHDASTLPQPNKGLIQSELARYVNVVVRVEWPLMQKGQISDAAHGTASRMIHLIADIKPENATQAALQTDMVTLTHAFNDARRERLFDNQQAIPACMWWTIFFISAVTIGSSYLFRVANLLAHLIMVVGLAAVIASILVLISEFDLPFRGDVHIAPTAFAHAFAAIAEDPPNSVYSPNAPK
ncbi:MAG: hypothetical protein ABI282_02535 [Candidatus Baltobacteraceae bacterium]